MYMSMSHCFRGGVVGLVTPAWGLGSILLLLLLLLRLLLCCWWLGADIKTRKRDDDTKRLVFWRDGQSTRRVELIGRGSHRASLLGIARHWSRARPVDMAERKAWPWLRARREVHDTLFPAACPSRFLAPQTRRWGLFSHGSKPGR